MNILQPTLILLAAFLAVFWQAAFPGLSNLLRTQIDLLPALMVFAALRASPVLIAVLAVTGGLFFDCLSANPLGITIVPLFAIGFIIYLRRDLLLRDQPYAQFILGAAASALMPLLVVLMLLTAGDQPLISWGSLWQWLVMSLAGGLATPLLFLIFEWGERTFGYTRVTTGSFRPDREIRRGRH